MAYDHKRIEAQWQQRWRERKTFRTVNDAALPKYYVLDMFPYPSGAGLHVGHPLGYIASDIVARHKRHCGFNVLHPMGYDSFGLPAEQYAIQTGQHPAKTTEENAARYRQQLDRIGFSFDWDREVRTSDPAFYQWTQWIFLQLFNCWYDPRADKARPISELIARFEGQGCQGQDASVLTGDIEEAMGPFTAAEWKGFSERTKQLVLQHFRMAYLSEAWVNWCPALGTVLANDEVKDGVSERGGHPVERKRMKQWSLRITAYAQRLLDGLNGLDWSESIKEAQRNWIGRSEGALVKFALTPSPSPEERGEGRTGPYPEEWGEGGTGASPEKERVSKTKRQFRETTDPFLWSKLIERAKAMRHAPTEAEDRLWQVIRGTATGGRIRRQHIIGKYIVDFVSLPKQLVIEVDGDIHDLQQEADAQRTLALGEMGFKVIRFRNDEVLHDPFAVKVKIMEEFRTRPDFRPDDEPGEQDMATSTDVEAEASPSPRERGSGGEVTVFTTRPDTLFGVSFITLAPEHELVPQLTTPERKAEVEAYVAMAKNRSERERQAEVDKVSGVFTGSYAKHPFTGADIPVWVGDYVLGGYGTGAVMAVPGGDQRDWRFAKHFGLPIIAVTEGAAIDKEADERKDAVICSEGFLKGLKVPQAITRAIAELEKLGAGEGKVNFRLRDAAFGRQRYWGEPIPIYYKDGIPYPLPESELPLVLPEVGKFLPTETGEPPLARAKDWTYAPPLSPGEGPGGEGAPPSPSERGPGGEGFPLETTTMPGWAGSSWYFLRYMDPGNAGRFASKEAINYWGQVDLYVGGSEHATGHLLYFRFWTKFLHDLGLLPFDEPVKKLVNQGMIQGVSRVAYSFSSAYVLSFSMISTTSYDDNSPTLPLDAAPTVLIPEDVYERALNDKLTDADLKQLKSIERKVTEHVRALYPGHRGRLFSRAGENGAMAYKRHIDVSLVNDRGHLDVVRFRNSEPGQPEVFTWGDSSYVCIPEVEKMSKSKFNVVNPDDIIEKYGADTLRLYEMFLGPLEQSKPWDTNGIEGTFRFLKKFWNLFHAGTGQEDPVPSTHRVDLSDDAPTQAELKTLHATLKKVSEDIGKMSFNTSVAQFMIAVNELSAMKCRKRAILEPLTIALSPFAPHIAEELWMQMGHADSISTAPWPQWEQRYLEEDSFSYPISFNGKTRLQLEFPIALDAKAVEAAVLANPEVQQRLEGKAPKKVIVVPKRIVNIVV